MHLRTAYLPEVGQPLTCRFDAENATVLAAGEVIWREEQGRGGEFGIRFTNLDPESAGALERIVGMGIGDGPRDPGTRVRLHIDGLGSPMRAKVRDSDASELRVGSDLGFLQVGKHLELEDTTTGRKRPARIDRVGIEVDAVSQIPQLIVTLRYDESTASAVDGASQALPTDAPKESTPEPSVIDDEPEAAAAAAPETEDLDAVQRATKEMKGTFARAAAQMGPAVARLARQTKATVALLASKRFPTKEKEDALPARRTTAPPPSGVLHSNGRRVVRQSSTAGSPESPARGPGRRVALGVRSGRCRGALLCSRAPSPLSAGRRGKRRRGRCLRPWLPRQPAPEAPTQATLSRPTFGATSPSFGAAPVAAPPPAMEERSNDDQPEPTHKKVHVTPFGSAVAHGNLLRLKMDGTIEKIEGAPTPTGFTVRVPDRRSLEAAAPLASRDARIGSIHVTNDADGAELALTFKDGVPNYQVRAKGDSLEILLAQPPKTDDAEPSPKRDVTSIAKRRHGKHGDKR